MNINEMINGFGLMKLSCEESKIPWNDPDFSQRMLENHLSQKHDWASRRFTVIEQHVAWIASQLPVGARVLDLGCGPGFYTHRLAQQGFNCTGVDFSPASIAYARLQAQMAGLNIDYLLQDVREYTPTTRFDFIMMTFGELNVFSAADARKLVNCCAQWLIPSGKLLIEVHTLEEVKRQGLAAPSWQRCAQGLFLDRPHLLLTEHQWDQEAQTSSTHFWTIEENGTVMRFGSQMTAWRDEAYLQLLTEGGFYSSQRVDPSDWPASDTFAGKLFVLLNQIM